MSSEKSIIEQMNDFGAADLQKRRIENMLNPQPHLPVLKTGDILELSNGTRKCKYLVVAHDSGGYQLSRVMRAKTKADNNRFSEHIYISFRGNHYKTQ
jgi:hypothetical protein